MLYQSLKTPLEQLHLDYLISTFPILERGASKPNLNFGRFDLVVQDCTFELKSRLHVQNQYASRKRPKSDQSWWMLDENQRKRNQEWCEQECYLSYWIFLIAETKEPLDTVTIHEDKIVTRDLYIVPWDAHNLVSLTSRQTERYLGLSRLMKAYVFDNHTLPKGNAHLASSLPLFVHDFFR